MKPPALYGGQVGSLPALDNAALEREFLTGAGGAAIGRVTAIFRCVLAAPTG